MRLLLDESVPSRLRRSITGHVVKTVVEAGWSGVKNGKLLALAGKEFDAFITVDKNLPFQQNLATLPIAVVVLGAGSIELPHLLPLMPALLRKLATIKPRTYTFVGMYPSIFSPWEQSALREIVASIKALPMYGDAKFESIFGNSAEDVEVALETFPVWDLFDDGADGYDPSGDLIWSAFAFLFNGTEIEKNAMRRKLSISEAELILLHDKFDSKHESTMRPRDQ